MKRLARYAPPDAFLLYEEDITTFLIRQLKRVSGDSRNGEDVSIEADTNPALEFDYVDWCSEEDFLHEHMACVIGLKILTNRCLARAEALDAERNANRIIKLMTAILVAGGRPRSFKMG